MQVENRHSALQKRMDDWDAFDPDLHAALNASLTPPTTGDQMQPTGTAHPAGSEATVQSAHQVHGQAQVQAERSGVTGQPAAQVQREPTLYGQPLSTVFTSGPSGPTQSHGTSQFPFVHPAHVPAQQVQPPPSRTTGGTVDSTGGSELSFAPHGAGGSSSGPNGGVLLPHSLPSMLAPTSNRDRVRLSPFR